MRHISSFLSAILSPLLMPTYGVFLALWVSVLCYLPIGTRLAVLFVILGITCVLPMIVIAVLHNFKIIEDKRLNNRRERWLPYLATIFCYVAAGFYLIHVHSPMWLTCFFWGAGVACLVSMLITFKWKISAHMAGIGGILAFLFYLHFEGLEAFNLFWVICAMIVISGALGTARIFLGRHTFWQVIAGFANGYICVYWFMKLFA